MTWSGAPFLHLHTHPLPPRSSSGRTGPSGGAYPTHGNGTNHHDRLRLRLRIRHAYRPGDRCDSGIGYETARQLAERGATVLLHGRTPEEAQAATDRLATTRRVDAARLCACAADFARLEEVELLAQRILQEHPDLDVLVNNAAMAAPERHTVTEDGNEISFQTNFLAHYVSTERRWRSRITSRGVLYLEAELEQLIGCLHWCQAGAPMVDSAGRSPERPGRLASRPSGLSHGVSGASPSGACSVPGGAPSP